MKRREQGMALVTALLMIVLLMAVMTVTLNLTLGNVRQTGDTVNSVQALAVAQGGRNVGQSILQGPVGTHLSNAVVELAQSNRIGNASTWVFASGATQTRPPADMVAAGLNLLRTNVQSRLPVGGCYGPFTLPTGERLSLRMTFTGALGECDGAAAETLPIGTGRFISGARNSIQTYSLPYVMVVTSTVQDARRTFTLNGEYQFDVGNGSFARFALLTHIHQAGQQGPENAGRIFFTSDTLFNGPVHTNGNFAFYGEPWFGGAVSSSGITDRQRQGGYFQARLCGGWGCYTDTQFRTPNQLNPPRYGSVMPSFQNGVDWAAAEIPLPTNSIDQSNAGRSSGIFIPASQTPANIVMSVGTNENSEVPGRNNQRFQSIQVGTAQYRAFEDGALFVRSNNQWVQARNANNQPITRFNGMIYAEGEIRSLKGPSRSAANDSTSAGPAVASFSQITVTSTSNIRITGDLKYEQNPCNGSLRRVNGVVNVPECETDPLAVRNVLGVYTSGGHVELGATNNDTSLNVPRDVQIHATLMSATGEVRVQNSGQAPCNGTGFILGGVIERTYGAFGTFNSSTGACSAGLGRSFTYDQRMLNGLAPPFFPTTQMTNLLPTRRIIQYGQTEQTRR